MARRFNGTSDYLGRESYPSAATDDISLVAWARPGSLTSAFGAPGIVYVGEDFGFYGFQINEANSQWQLSFTGGADNHLDSGVVAAVNRWDHLGMRRTGGAWEIFINGVRTAGPFATSLHALADRMTIGGLSSIPTVGFFFTGDIAEVATWDEALADADFVALAAGASPATIGTARTSYYRLVADTDNEPDYVGTVNSMAVVGTTAIAHPFAVADDATIDGWSLEQEFAGAGGGWTDVRDDLMMSDSAPIVAEYGISGNEPSDRTADPGAFAFPLDNSDQNAAGLVGYYALAHANKRSGFDYNIGTRWRIPFFGQTYTKFRGTLADIATGAGLRGGLVTRCVARDWMDDASQEDLPDLEAQENITADDLIDLILDSMTTPPVARDLDDGSDVYRWALDGGASGGRSKVREILHQIAMSEYGLVFLRGDGTLRLQQRGGESLAVAYTFDDTQFFDDLETPSSRDEIVGRVKVTVHPTEVDAAATTVLYELETTEILVRAGATNDTLFGPYRDPSTSAKGGFIGGTDPVSPVATTDYEMNSVSDGSGTDLTGDFTVTASATGRGVRWTIVNNGAVDGYITKLQLRGRGIYRSDAVVDVPVAGAAYGARVLEINMPFQGEVTVGENVATYLGTVLGTPAERVQAVTFLANVNDELMLQALAREPGDVIGIRETRTGIDAAFVIHQIRLELQASGLLYCTFRLAPVVTIESWRLGISSYSELGETTVLGI